MLKKGYVLTGIYNGRKYIIDEKIGHGGVADVYLVHDENNLKYALKISDDLISITREYKVLTLLKSCDFAPCIFDLDDALLYNKMYHYIVLEYIDGYSLDELIKTGIDLDRALYIFTEILDILLRLKRLGIFYTDLKPSNVMIDERKKRIVLIDYGSTSAAGEIVKEFTPEFDRASWKVVLRKADSGYLSFEAGMLFVYLVGGKTLSHDSHTIGEVLKHSKGRLGKFYIAIMKALNGTYDINKLYINFKNGCFSEKASMYLNYMLFTIGIIFVVLMILAV
ncbi:AarF/UbiB family protein [Thermoanaerobacterium sp. CMT5567-10]|uniref:protein kinase domain-containing protein n=1 Tax=Thermoanaerobacterium sp. CMT5567-10 TaxID=3061989 RepID=UPI0026DEAA3B|nr:AarF/UbiB family protein [Thermoanaerobacterium sp. CMT5567-10]WKV07888.1 AarF/UbiB family protein [Thermoanaerobacterium sp. CMT5567-10]